MKPFLMGIGASLFCLILQSCAVLKSMEGTNSKLPKNGGVYYSLPKAVLNVTLSDQSGELTITVTKPTFVPDITANYLLQYKPSLFATDAIEITVDPETNLLQTVSAETDDQSGQIIVKLAQAAAMIAQSGKISDRGEEHIIFDRTFDPSNHEEVCSLQEEMTTVSKAHAKNMFQKNCTGTLTDDKKSACDAYTTLIDNAKIKFDITPPKTTPAEPADCSIGICYRALAPYYIRFVFNDQYSFSTIVNLPNEQPAIVLPLGRTPFVKRQDKVEFQNGILKSVKYIKPSEALAIASLPVSIMTAIFESISNLVQLKIDLSSKEKSLVDAKQALLVAIKELQEKADSLKKQTGGITSPDVLLSGSSGGRHRFGALKDTSGSTGSSDAAGNQDDDRFSPGNAGSLKTKETIK